MRSLCWWTRARDNERLTSEAVAATLTYDRGPEVATVGDCGALLAASERVLAGGGGACAQ
jgi:hypothetical protein